VAVQTKMCVSQAARLRAIIPSPPNPLNNSQTAAGRGTVLALLKFIVY